MNRFFRDINDKCNDCIKIDGEDYHHIKNVLRLQVNDHIEIISEKYLYTCIIQHITKEYIDVKIEDYLLLEKEKLEIHLFQGLAKSDKFDFIIQKSVELGINSITPLITKRNIVKLKDKSLDNRMLRYQKISLNAASQSHRTIIPKVNYPIDINNIILEGDELGLVVYENSKDMNLKSILKKCNKNKIKIVIGPEGGFELSEIEILQKKGFNIVSLGKRILRTETAPLNLLSIIDYELGSFE